MRAVFFYTAFFLMVPLVAGAQEGLLLPSRGLQEPVPGTPGSAAAGLWHGEERTVRYTPVGGDFVIVNGRRRFNRALYGTNTAFRVEAGDLPEFALYMPGMGGNWRFGLSKGDSTKWLIEAKYIKAVYRPGSMIYTIRDPFLGGGSLSITVLALSEGEGMVIRVQATGIDPALQLSSIYGGASGKKFTRDGDIGADPESSFFCKPENCVSNRYTIDRTNFTLSYGAGKTLTGSFPAGSSLQVSGGDTPVLKSLLSLQKSGPVYWLVQNAATKPGAAPAVLFERAESARKKLAGRVIVHTPDAYINTLGGALAIAADAIWEAPSYLHGAIAWRMRLPAWRGPYVADVLGWHDRARQHFSSYALSQVTTPEIGPVVADTALHLARQLEKMGTALFSNGYICRNPGGDWRPHHYDMNLVFIDALLDHFYWTGDTAYVRAMWPVLTRHLAWEKRNFDPDGDGLYDAYCCIWASDALEYSGGGVTHSTAYNYRANKVAADLALLIGGDPEPYRRQAALILHALNTKLWMPQKGWYAEYMDRDGGMLHPAAGLWTVYHAIDSHVPDAFQAWQTLHYIDTDIPHIPIRAKGLKDTGLYTLSTTNWQPYAWSLNNVVMAESLHTALAYWQGGRAEEAMPLWKGALVESMYLGASPGNFQQISSYDAMRGELYRDFADPIGMAARSLVEGLFGIRPDALHDTLTIQPGWPLAWRRASLQIPDITLHYLSATTPDHQLSRDSYTIVPAFGRTMNLAFKVRARSDNVLSVTVNGRTTPWKNADGAVGSPLLLLTLPPAAVYHIVIRWGAGVLGDKKATVLKVYDPQTENKTIFRQLRQGRFTWWQPVYEKLPHRALPADAPTEIDPHAAGTNYDTIGLTDLFNDVVTNIFKNKYLSPRAISPTLQLPVQGIGNWCYPLVTADIDDAGLRRAAGEKAMIVLPSGIPFATPGTQDKDNILFTSRWDNYPDSALIPLRGKASHAWFLMAGSTNPMQSRITNGMITIFYKDGTTDSLELINPSTWWPIEQDYYQDGFAFTTDAPRPVRIELKTGRIRTSGGDWTPIKGFTDTGIPGGAATVLDMRLQPGKELDRLVLRTAANEVVVGLMSVTLLRN